MILVRSLNFFGCKCYFYEIAIMKSILVIDDNNDIRENTAEILSLAGYKTITAENGKKGVEAAIKNLPDLIICDIMMPELMVMEYFTS